MNMPVRSAISAGDTSVRPVVSLKPPDARSKKAKRSGLAVAEIIMSAHHLGDTREAAPVIIVRRHIRSRARLKRHRVRKWANRPREIATLSTGGAYADTRR